MKVILISGCSNCKIIDGIETVLVLSQIYTSREKERTCATNLKKRKNQSVNKQDSILDVCCLFYMRERDNN